MATLQISKVPTAQADEVKCAALAGLRYSIPKGKGITRENSGEGFTYFGPSGQVISDEDVLARIASLVIPPAWNSVWISPSANGHIQAVGWDAKGRKQYRYHPAYRAIRDSIKFDRMKEFGKALPRIRRIVGRDLALPGLPKRKILAALVRLLETTYIRIGNEEYAKENESFGLTTLQNQHVQVLGEVLKFRFRGKSGVSHEIKLQDGRLARIIKKCRCIPGSDLFQYLNENGEPASIESGDVNEYIREISRGEFTAKDFRTWGGTCLAVGCLLAREAAAAQAATEAAEESEKKVATQKELKSTLVEVVKEVAAKLGNRPATCKKYYIHPNILDHYSTGSLVAMAKNIRSGGAHAYEQIVLKVLKSRKRLKLVA